MKSKKPNFVEEQFRSSQMYKTMKNAGDVPKSVAQGLEKAAIGIDVAINSVDKAFFNSQNSNNNSAVNHNNGANQTPPGRPVPPPGRPMPPRQPRPDAVRPIRQHVPSSGHFKKGAMPVAGPGQSVKTIRKNSYVKYVVTAIIAAMYVYNNSLYGMGDFVRFGIVVAAIFGISSAIFKDKVSYLVVDDEPVKVEPEKPAKPINKKRNINTGDPEADALIEEGYQQLEKIHNFGFGINDMSIKDCLARMEKAFSSILDYITANPDKSSQVRRFMNYYLPTTIKLLDTYIRLDRQAVKGENIITSMEDIDKFMFTVADAFEKQLDSLFSDDAMDISADISVFETMLKQEGLHEEAELQFGAKE